MKQDSKLTGIAPARQALYVLVAVALVALWTPFGLVLGLMLLTFGALGTGIWLYIDKYRSHGASCGDCEFYKGLAEAMGRCTRKDMLAWPKATVCNDFVKRSPSSTR